jgi:DNA-binding NtrC family response regulator
MATSTVRPAAVPRSAIAAAPRTAILTSADLSFRERVRDALTGLRWEVREAAGGAEALAHLGVAPAEAMILDSWLPDLEIEEFVTEFEKLYPSVDLVLVNELSSGHGAVRSPRRNELLYALRRSQDADGASWNSAPVIEREIRPEPDIRIASCAVNTARQQPALLPEDRSRIGVQAFAGKGNSNRLPEFIGEDPAMLEVSRRIRLAAPHTAAVLVQGPTGTGKELVARAIHRLSPRSSRPFVALNCAAIPESLLEAELFGHTRGAFTGAVQGRTGRIEAAHGGTLFLDEIGEMPLALQAKLLRFVESGELQRIGENEQVRVDVRIVAATHRSLLLLTSDGNFRADLYYRLAVFLIRTPALASHREDLLPLAHHFLVRLGETSPAKSLSPGAVSRLEKHSWPGNVRELEHVLERAWILAENRPEITEDEIEFGEADAEI